MQKEIVLLDDDIEFVKLDDDFEDAKKNDKTRTEGER